MKTTVPTRKVNWIPLPDPITEDQVKIDLGNWTADAGTRRSIVRQAKLMNFKTPAEYLNQALAAVLAGNEADTFIGPDGELVNGCDIDRDGLPQNV
jgi:hypothetical protein